MIPLVTASYMQSLGGSPGAAAAAASSAALSAAINVASRACESYCQRSFYGRGWSDDRYDPISRHSLSLRHAPLIQINTVTLFPDGPSPQVFTPASFDIDYRAARLTFQYNRNGTFYSRLFNAGPFGGARADLIAVNYFAGYGFVAPLSAAAATGATSITLTQASGRVPGQKPWAVTPGTYILDSGLSTEETITVSAVAGTALTCSELLYDHAAGAYLSGSLATEDVQMACAIIVGNLLSIGDLSKEQEMVGRLGGYVYTQRKGGALITHEVKELLAPYKEIVV